MIKHQKLELCSVREFLKKYSTNISYESSLFYDVLYEISTFLFKIRTDTGMSKKDFAKVLGITPSMVSKYESGEYNFSLRQLCSLCDKLNLELKLVEIGERENKNENT